VANRKRNHQVTWHTYLQLHPEKRKSVISDFEVVTEMTDYGVLDDDHLLPVGEMLIPIYRDVTLASLLRSSSSFRRIVRTTLRTTRRREHRARPSFRSRTAASSPRTSSAGTSPPGGSSGTGSDPDPDQPPQVKIHRGAASRLANTIQPAPGGKNHGRRVHGFVVIRLSFTYCETINYLTEGKRR